MQRGNLFLCEWLGTHEGDVILLEAKGIHQMIKKAFPFIQGVIFSTCCMPGTE